MRAEVSVELKGLGLSSFAGSVDASVQLTILMPNGDRFYHETTITLGTDLGISIINQVEAALDRWFKTPEGVS